MTRVKIVENWQDKDLVSAYYKLFEIPEDETITFLNGLDLKQIPPPDFSHQRHHIQTVINYCAVIATQKGLSEYWQEKIYAAAEFHDITNGFTSTLDIERKEHASLASVIVYLMTGDKDIADIVYYHDQDIIALREGELREAALVLRNADRISFMGYSGLIRHAYYWGYRHNEMSKPSELMLERMIVCDPRCNPDGLPLDVDLNTRKLCLDDLFLFAINKGLLALIVLHCETNIKRFFGEKKGDEDFLSALLSRKNSWSIVDEFQHRVINAGYNIEPISESYRSMFYLKIIQDYEILQIARNLLRALEENPSTNLYLEYESILQYINGWSRLANR